MREGREEEDASSAKGGVRSAEESEVDEGAGDDVVEVVNEGGESGEAPSLRATREHSCRDQSSSPSSLTEAALWRSLQIQENVQFAPPQIQSSRPPSFQTTRIPFFAHFSSIPLCPSSVQPCSRGSRSSSSAGRSKIASRTSFEQASLSTNSSVSKTVPTKTLSSTRFVTRSTSLTEGRGELTSSRARGLVSRRREVTLGNGEWVGGSSESNSERVPPRRERCRRLLVSTEETPKWKMSMPRPLTRAKSVTDGGRKKWSGRGQLESRSEVERAEGTGTSASGVQLREKIQTYP